MKKKSAIILIFILLAATALLYTALLPKSYYRIVNNKWNAFHSKNDTSSENNLQIISDHEFKKGDYTVRLLFKPDNTWGFDIRKGNQVIHLQHANPFNITPDGFISQNDALNVAWWMVEKFKTTGKAPIPTEFNEILEKELNIQRRTEILIHKH